MGRALKFLIGLLCAAALFRQGRVFGQTSGTWSFAVSGDSRNCGDIVMPGIAAGARADGAKFYWHLGDFRMTGDFDEDLLAAPEYRSRRPSVAEYQQNAWTDFIAHQIEPFGNVPVF